MTILSILKAESHYNVNLELTVLPEASGVTISNLSMSNHGLRSRHQRCPRSKIDFMRCPLSHRLVRSLVVIQPEILGKKIGKNFVIGPIGRQSWLWIDRLG